jgi:hypothetical protein
MATGRIKVGARVAFVATYWSEGTSLRGQGTSEVFEVNNECNRRNFDLSLTVEGKSASRTLQLKTSLILIAPSADMLRDSLAPKRAGSVLWEDSISIILDGNAPRFPVSIIDFVESGLGPEGSCWRFEWFPQDPSAPAMASMRLYINSRHRAFHDAIVSTNPSPCQLAVRSALKHDIGKELVSLAIQNCHDLELIERHEVGTSGRVLMDLVARVFPGRTPADCAELLKNEPGAFSAQLQAAMALFTDPELDANPT